MQTTAWHARDRALLGAALAGLVAYAWGWFAIGENFMYSNWSDRDLIRSANLPADFPTAGAELSYGNGARVPGGLLHYIWFLALQLNDSPLFVFQVQFGLSIAAGLLLYATAARYYGRFAGIVAAAVYLLSPLTLRNVGQLWNPGFLPFFAALSLYLTVRAMKEDRAGLLPWSAAAALAGAQMHLTGLLLLIPIVLSPLLIRSARRGGPWLGVVAALLVLYSPYIVSELVSGFANANLMRSHVGEQVRRHENGFFSTANLLDFIVRVVEFRHPDRHPSVWNSRPVQLIASIPAALALIGLLLGIVRGRLRFGPFKGWEPDAAHAAMAFSFLACWLYFALSFQIELKINHSARYLVVPLMLGSLLAAAAVSAIGDALSERGYGRLRLSAAIALLVALVLGCAVVTRGNALRSDAVAGYHWRMQKFQQVAQVTGWKMEEIPSKLALWLNDPQRGGWYWDAADAMEYEVFRRGRRFAGSGNSPCGVILSDGDPPGTTEEAEALLRERFAQDLGDGFRVLSVHRLDSDALVVYARPAGRCIISYANRYVLSPEEQATQRAYSGLPPDTARRVEGDPAGYLLALNSERCRRGCNDKIVAYLRIRGKPGGVDVELHSNQLRGQAYNFGFFLLGMIGRPRLVLEDAAGDRHEVKLAHDLVGHKGELTPLAVTAAVPPGRYRVVFEADVIPEIDQTVWPMPGMTRIPKRIVIDGDFLVPG